MFSTDLNVHSSARPVFLLFETYMISETPDRNGIQILIYKLNLSDPKDKLKTKLLKIKLPYKTNLISSLH